MLLRIGCRAAPHSPGTSPARTLPGCRSGGSPPVAASYSKGVSSRSLRPRQGRLSPTHRARQGVMRHVVVFEHLVHSGCGHGPVGVLLGGAQPGRQRGLVLCSGDRCPQAAPEGRGLNVLREEAALRAAVGGGHRTRSPAATQTRRHAATVSPNTTQAHWQAATPTRRHTTAPTSCQNQAQPQARRQAGSANPAPRRRPLQPLVPATKGLAAAGSSTTPPRHRRRCRHRLQGETCHSRSATYLLSTPPTTRIAAPQSTSLTGPEQHQGQPAVSSAPYQSPVCAHVQQMPRYCRHHGPQLNPVVESVSTCAAGSPRTCTAQDYEDSPRPTAAASLHESTMRTHTHANANANADAHAQGHRPARGPWWQRWTHTQLWELRRCAPSETGLEGLVCQPCRKMSENRQLQPAGGSMPQDA